MNIRKYLLEKLEKHDYKTLTIEVGDLHKLLTILDRLKYKYSVWNNKVSIKNLYAVDRDKQNIIREIVFACHDYKMEVIENNTLMNKLYKLIRCGNDTKTN